MYLSVFMIHNNKNQFYNKLYIVFCQIGNITNKTDINKPGSNKPIPTVFNLDFGNGT